MLIQITENHIINPDQIAHIRVMGDTLKIYFTDGYFDDIKITLEEFKNIINKAQRI